MTVDVEPFLRLGLAALLSLPVGLEREIRGKPAGVRTHMLLAVASAGLGWLSLAAADGRDGADATRIASYTVAGVGFLGAGLIVGIRGQVHGLTTAVAAFMVMSIGLITGMGFGAVAIAMTVISVLTLGPIEWLKPRTYGRLVRTVVTFHVIVEDPARIATIQDAIISTTADLQTVGYTPLGGGKTAMQLTVRGRSDELRTAMASIEALSEVEGITAIAHGDSSPD